MTRDYVPKRARKVRMNKEFRDLVAGLPSKCRDLLAMEPIIASEVPTDTPVGGVYLFSEGSTHLYAGRTKRKIAERIKYHFGRASDCPFAWRLALKATRRAPTYKREGSHKELLKDPDFKDAYERAKKQIRQMRVRYVEERDPIKQALLEIYVAVATKAKHNSFATH